jgi:hypothetical protein
MGSPESHGVQAVWEQHFGESETSVDDVIASRAQGTMLRRVPTLAEVGNVAALMASDLASADRLAFRAQQPARDARNMLAQVRARPGTSNRLTHPVTG